MLKTKQIIAVGGGGFPYGRGFTPLKQYILQAAWQSNPRICFLPTASGDADCYISSFYESFRDTPCRPSHLPLFNRLEDRPAEKLLDQDIIFVGGGNTASMMAVWRAHGVEEVLRDAYLAGIILCGVSAGAMCWFSFGITDSFGLPFRVIDPLLSLLPHGFCPHFDAESGRESVVTNAVISKRDSVLALGDDVAAHFINGQLLRVVSTRSSPTACRFFMDQEESGREALQIDQV